MISEKEVEQIKDEASKLLEKFSIALEKVKSEGESNVERESDRRIEGDGQDCDKDFRKIMLENAPQHDEDFIMGERKSW